MNTKASSATVSIHKRKQSDRAWRELSPFLQELLAPFRLPLLLATMLTCVVVLFQAGPVWLTRNLIDRVVIPGDLGSLHLWGGAMLVLATLGILTESAIGLIMGHAGSRLTAGLRSRLHTHALRLPVGYFDLTPSGEITSRIMQDTMTVERFVIEQLPFIFVRAATFLLVGVALFWIDPWLGIVAVAPIPPLLIGSYAFSGWQRGLVRSYFALNDQMNTAIHETVRGIKPIKAACRESGRAGQFDNISRESGCVEFNTNALNVVFGNSMTWVISLGSLGVWYAGSYRSVESGTLSPGLLVAAAGLTRIFHAPLQFATRTLHQWVGMTAAAARIADFLDTPIEQPSEGEEHANVRVRGEIEFREVRFSYIPGSEVIHDISFHVQPGEMIGLVGRSGVGKTTLMNLLCRFYDVGSGSICVDGSDIRELDLTAYRRNIGIVLQEPHLFHASIEENIRFARPDATRAQVIEAARKAQAHEFIEQLESGYDTAIGDKGIRLSTGEAQRIVLARVILQAPPLLLLDEATSNLDTATEAKVQEAILTLIRGRTTIAIAHRLSTLRHSTRLLVLDEGKLVESGTHDELCARSGGVYAALVQAQTERYLVMEAANVWSLDADSDELTVY